MNLNMLYNVDHQWMSYINGKKKLNEINIPGTHDSATLIMKNGFVDEFANTQSLNIMEQLKRGIRYFDLRITLGDEDNTNLYLTHNEYICYDPDNTDEKLYFSKVLNDFINYLNTFYNETIIIHLKREKIPDEIPNNFDTQYPEKNYLAKIIAEHTILNENTVENPKYSTKTKVKDYFYYENEIPTLDQVRNKIVIVTRDSYTYDNKPLGVQISVPEMKHCTEYSNKGGKNDGVICYPILTNNYNTRIQDDYNLEEDDKWDMIYDMITNNIPSRSENKTNDVYTVYDDTITNRFYDTLNTNVLTLNFLNMARMSTSEHVYHIITDLFDTDIEGMADYVNFRLESHLWNKASS
ncbi:PLC-like phosphodiesterase [Anaeromyces robustus]|uniref:PLC-like phosphodiesterase n=1 Tax=Anaeromyces robustus TaxID=1754192 RepID=A0A1Y1WP85_9FUNG|nr:PLC-like phosphodiesterase [Anaeromyces robustus]|eukprot:ORX75333.1 PLC-like phosphodiesterase [Anaeromyces robustus]